MKYNYTISTLALLLYSSAQAIRVQEKTKEEPKKHGFISIDIDSVNYIPERVQTVLAEQSQVDQDFNKRLDDAFGGKYQSLIQKIGGFNLVQKHKPKAGGEGIDLDNLQNLGYEGKLWIGQPAQEMSVIFDTGSSIPWVLSETCKTGSCPKKNNKFSEARSTSFHTEKIKGTQKLTYGRGMVAGQPAQDTVCFNKGKSNCVEKMSFLTITKAHDVESLEGSGLIGLSPTPAKRAEIEQPFTHGVPGFITQLSHNTKFKNNFESMFSIYLSHDTKKKGKITFGGYDLANLAKKGTTEKDVTWFTQSRNMNYWVINSKEVLLGQTQISEGKQQAILDNGMSFGMAPQDDFIRIVKILSKEYGIHCESKEPCWVCVIPTPQAYMKLPSLKFSFVQDVSGKTKEIIMPRHAYLKVDLFASAKDDAGNKLMVAKLLFHPHTFKGLGVTEGEQYWILGAQFLQNYYSIYDFKTKKIGLVESVSSNIHNGTFKDAASTTLPRNYD